MEHKTRSAVANAAAEPKPVVVVSQCLGFAAVRYNGIMLQDDFIRSLRDHVRFVQVCPEVGIGLGVPRDPIRIVMDQGERRLVQPTTGRELTQPMRRFAENFLAGVGPVDGFILKSRSPSCGIKDVKVFAAAESAPSLGSKHAGFFAEAVLRRFPHAAVEDEGRLTNFRLRHHFLLRLFAAARFRAVLEEGKMAALVQYHTAYKLQWMAYSHTGLRELGRIVANPDNLSPPKVMTAYAERLAQLLVQPARSSATCNALQHAFGYVSDHLAAREKQYFLKLLEEYRDERRSVSSVLSVLQAWVLRCDQDYLAGQHFFEPYPAALISLADSGGGAG